MIQIITPEEQQAYAEMVRAVKQLARVQAKQRKATGKSTALKPGDAVAEYPMRDGARFVVAFQGETDGRPYFSATTIHRNGIAWADRLLEPTSETEPLCDE